MQAPKIMAIIVLGRCASSILGYGIKKHNQKELYGVDDQNLFRILPYDVVIRNSPHCRVVFDSLDMFSRQ